jgi:glucose-1-phosphate cytidylyltransferase
MKVVILAGGLGTRLSEETEVRPKPLVEIGGHPIVWHIMKLYAQHGFREFIVCLGYKGYMLKEYFAQYVLHHTDVTVDMACNKLEMHHLETEAWKVTLVDTGMSTMTGGRIKRIRDYVSAAPFMLTYGDGVGDIDISKLVAWHQQHGQLATITAVQPSGRFGALRIGADNQVERFEEKPQGDKMWINGGFFVLQPEVFEYIAGDNTVWENEPLERLAREGNLVAYKHHGFWQAMDTLRDKRQLNDLWDGGTPPWRVWA